MSRGGLRPGAGRPAGSLNKRTRETVAEIEATGVTPLQFLLQVMRNPAKPDNERIEAAKAAAPYVHARLSIQENIPPAPEIPKPEEIKDRIRQLLASNPDLLTQAGITQ